MHSAYTAAPVGLGGSRSFSAQRFFANYDWLLTLMVFMMCVAGLGLLHSAGYDPETGTSSPMKRQLFAIGAGFTAFFITAAFKTSFWRRWAYPIYAAGCVLLVLILIHGRVAGGAQRWLELGAFRMQPSEFMKIGLILALGRLFSSEYAPEGGYTLGKLWLPAIVIGIPSVLILVEPDLGTALCHILIGGSMMLIFGVRWKTLLTLAMLGLMLAIPAWGMLKDYQKQRILTFLSPEDDPLGSGYHAIQSKIAVGSGALTGKGFMEGTQTQLRFLPEQTTDFIFSVLAEEWGFVGSISALALYGFLIAHLFGIGIRSSDRFASFVSFGIGIFIFWHVLVNIGMVVGILPVVGLTLPLLSYGGSSMVAFMAGLGIVVGISSRRFMFA
jgi:rod shape determining protein RodA